MAGLNIADWAANFSNDFLATCNMEFGRQLINFGLKIKCPF